MCLRSIWVFCLVCFLCLGTALAGDDDPVLGKVGDYLVHQSDVDRLITYHSAENRKALQEKPEERVALVNRILEVRVVSDEAKKAKFDERPDIKEQIRYLVDDFVAREYLTQVVMKDVSVTDEKIKEFYNLNEKNMISPEQVRIRHIFIQVPTGSSQEAKDKLRGKADALIERVKIGDDFARLASEYSEDPNPELKRNGGDLGYVPRGRLLEPVEEAAFSIKPGEVSGVIESQYGFHIVKVEDHREARQQTFDEVKDWIRAKLENEYAQLKGKEFVAEAAKKVGMEVYSDKITGNKTNP